jgi:SAM-dependent methyltransferase
MNGSEADPTAVSGPSAPEPGFFQQWRTYRKMVDNDYLFHRAAYGSLRSVLSEEAPPGFRFLDLGCGDAGPIVEALRGLDIGFYRWVDSSETALGLARENLAVGLPCPVALDHADLAEALRRCTERFDVVWIGLALHHLGHAGKLGAMRQIRRIVPGGMLLLYENTSPDGEAREGWLRRWDDQKPDWTAYTPAEWDTANAHVHAADFPETVTGWRALGHAAGFSSVRELFCCPTDLFRLFAFR